MTNEEAAIDYVNVWRYDISPETTGCNSCNNVRLRLRFNDLNLTIYGTVVWHTDISEYVFHFKEHRSPSWTLGVQDYIGMYTKETLQHITETINSELGVSKTNGMYELPEHVYFMHNPNHDTIN